MTVERWAALHNASHNGHEACVRQLLSSSACDVNMRVGTFGHGTALHFAASHGHLGCLKALVELRDALQVGKLSNAKNAMALRTSSPTTYIGPPP